MKKAGGIQFVAGVIAGAAIFGSSAAVAAGILAQPKTAAAVIDGNTVDLKGYVIDGAHYFQLRDLSEKLAPGGKDFSVTWDAQGNRVIIDTSKGYSGNTMTPASTPTPAATENERQPAMAIDDMKAEIIRLANLERAKAGLPGLQVLPELMQTAQAKADDMLANGYYGHTSPTYGTSSQMIRAAVPWAGPCAENLAPWTKTPAEAFAGWLESPEHHAIMLRPFYTHTGVGIVEGKDGGYWWVQHFTGA